MAFALTRIGTVAGEFRVPRRFKKAVHWVDRRGEIACGTPLTSEQLADGRLQDDIGVVTCASCCKAIELDRQKDFFGRPKVREPEPVDYGPLFEPGKRR